MGLIDSDLGNPFNQAPTLLQLSSIVQLGSLELHYIPMKLLHKFIYPKSWYYKETLNIKWWWKQVHICGSGRTCICNWIDKRLYKIQDNNIWKYSINPLSGSHNLVQDTKGVLQWGLEEVNREEGKEEGNLTLLQVLIEGGEERWGGVKEGKPSIHLSEIC